MVCGGFVPVRQIARLGVQITGQHLQKRIATRRLDELCCIKCLHHTMCIVIVTLSIVFSMQLRGQRR